MCCLLSTVGRRRQAWALPTVAHVICASSVLLACVASCGSRARPTWVGRGKYRLLVRVEPADLGSRSSDEMPTRIAIPPELLRSQLGVSGKIDVAPFELEDYEECIGRPIGYVNWAYTHV